MLLYYALNGARDTPTTWNTYVITDAHVTSDP